MSNSRYKALVDTLASEIRSGRLPPGTRLPTHRKLAAKHGLALVTATRVYAELQAMGLVSGETGRGSFVRETALSPGHGIDQHATATGMLDLNFNYPSLPGQGEMLRAALRQLAASGDIDALLRYQPHDGRLHERASIARHLASRGLDVSGEQVQIVSGAQHGLMVTAMALLQPGDVVAVDALTYPGFKVVAESLHLELLPLAMNNEGSDLDALERACRQRKLRAVYTMPTMHNPLGMVMNTAWRQQLLSIARKHGLLIIEDAAYAFLANRPPAPLAAIAPELTVYVSGFSKNVSTGLRVGYVVAPPQYQPAITRAIRASSWNTPALMTSLVCNWIEDGTVARLEKEKRADARARQSLAAKLLAGLDYTSHPTSYFIWLPLPAELRSDQIAVALEREKIAVSTAEPFATSPHIPHALRLALGSVDMHELKVALEKFRQVMDRYVY